jgi:hypothetical protein
MLRKAAGLPLREDELAVRQQVELPFPPASISASCSVSAFNSAARLAARWS